MLEQFHFLRPWWLLLLLAALGAWWWQSRKRIPTTNWSQVVDAHLLPHLLSGTKKIRSKSAFWLPLFLALMSIALAGPTFERVKSSSNLVGRPLIVVIELSQHMLSTDISPSRLKRALYKLKDVLTAQKEHEVALIAFAGDAHVVAPLTMDHKTIVMLSEALGPDTMPIEGSRLLSGLKEAASMSTTGADILVITSTNVEESAASIGKFIEEQHMRVIFWSFATDAGAPIVGRDGRFDATRSGSVTISQLRHDWLKELEKSSKVHSVAVSADDSDEHTIAALLGKQFHESSNDEESIFDTWHDLGPYVLALAMLVFLMASFFVGPEWWMLSLVLLLPGPKAHAWNFSDWFVRSDQKAYQALQENKPEEAAKLYEDDFSKGTALYKAKNYQEALKHFAEVNTSDGRYNLGNTLANLNKIPEAIAAYTDALKFNPHNTDAQHNKEILEKLMKEQENKKQEPKDQENQEESQSKENKEQEKQEKPQSNEDKDQNPQEQKEDSQPGSNQNQGKDKQGHDQQKNADEQKSKGEEKSSGQEKEEKEKKQEKEKSPGQQEKPMPEQTQKEEHAAAGAEEIDPNTRHYFEQLEQNNNFYLKRKFREESRRKSEAR